MKVKCIRDVCCAYTVRPFSKGEVYTVDKEYDYGVSIYVNSHLYNGYSVSYMFYYDSSVSRYMGFMYEDHFVSVEEYRDKVLMELGI